MSWELGPAAVNTKVTIATKPRKTNVHTRSGRLSPIRTRTSVAPARSSYRPDACVINVCRVSVWRRLSAKPSAETRPWTGGAVLDESHELCASGEPSLLQRHDEH